MVSKKVNVLVYAGTGSTLESVRHCLYTLRRLLSPNYAVIPINESAIIKEPWTASCALLVMPGGADLGYCRVLNGQGNARIDQYVRRGGSYLGLCAGGYYGSARCEFEVGDKKMQVVGNRELGFFPGTCRGCAFKGFMYHSEAGTRASLLDVDGKAFEGGVEVTGFRSYYNGGGVFVDAAKMRDRGVEVLASYVEEMDVEGGSGGKEDAAAAVYCKVGDGGAILTGPHPEFAAVNLNPESGGPEYAAIVKAIEADDEQRTTFMKACLSKLNLDVVKEESDVPPLSRLHLSSINHTEVGELLHELKEIITIGEDGEEYIKGANDTFHFEQQSSRFSLDALKKNMPQETSTATNSATPTTNPTATSIDPPSEIKTIIPHETDWPATKETPQFNHHEFYSALQQYRSEKSSTATSFGTTLLYGEVVTSTNTLLEKNPTLLEKLPPGFTATATIQTSGRGRGSNVWVSPPGSLMFSTLLSHPLSASTRAPVVFIQYLMAIAIVQGIHTYDHGYATLPVKLKWPNDIYALDPTSKTYIKIGGILINSTYTPSSKTYNLICGAGLNTSNPTPTTSLNTLLTHHTPSLTPFTLPRLLARILTTFETLYNSFLRTGWDRVLEERYYKLWLHSGQIVELEAEGGRRARVVGVSRDWGMLRVEELGWEDRGTGRVWELQSDSNSFDFFKGLVRRKV